MSRCQAPPLIKGPLIKGKFGKIIPARPVVHMYVLCTDTNTKNAQNDMVVTRTAQNRQCSTSSLQLSFCNYIVYYLINEIVML